MGLPHIKQEPAITAGPVMPKKEKEGRSYG
jgi:hypothetical protein